MKKGVNRGMASWVILLWMTALGLLFGTFMIRQHSSISSVTKVDEKSNSYINAEGYARELIKKISNGQNPGIGDLATPSVIGTCTGNAGNDLVKIPENGLCLLADRIYSLKVIGCSDSDCDVWTEISVGFEVEEK